MARLLLSLLRTLTASHYPALLMSAGFWVMSVGCLYAGFWVWGPLIENLALIGYTGGDNLAMAPYDWR